MAKAIVVSIVAILLCIPSQAQFPCLAPGTDFPKEDLPYDIIYQWGFIWKRAGIASLKLDTIRKQKTKYYQSHMIARTLAFADRIFKVRDTLVSVMKYENLQPIYYAKIANEDNTYRKDVVQYSYNNDGSTNGKITLYRPKRNAIEHYDVHSATCTFDMLSVFYYMRTLDYPKMDVGQRINLNIYSGNHVEYLSIEFMGRTLVKLKNRQMGAYKIKLHFSTDKGENESDNITAWISDDERRIPLQVEGKLAIGSMKAMYTGK